MYLVCVRVGDSAPRCLNACVEVRGSLGKSVSPTMWVLGIQLTNSVIRLGRGHLYKLSCLTPRLSILKHSSLATALTEKKNYILNVPAHSKMPSGLQNSS